MRWYFFHTTPATLETATMWHRTGWQVRRGHSLSLATTSSIKVCAIWCKSKWRKLHEVHHRKKPNLGRIKCWRKERHYSKNLACYIFVSLIMENFNTHWTVTAQTYVYVGIVFLYPFLNKQSCIFSISFTFKAIKLEMQCVSNSLSIVNMRKMDPITPVLLRCHTRYSKHTVDKY